MPPTPAPLRPSQAAWCELPSRVLLVLTSQRGVQVRPGGLGGVLGVLLPSCHPPRVSHPVPPSQMYESDGSTMVFWHALHVPEHPAGESPRDPSIPPETPESPQHCQGHH